MTKRGKPIIDIKADNEQFQRFIIQQDKAIKLEESLQYWAKKIDEWREDDE